MENVLDLYIVNRSDGNIKGYSRCFKYEINRDYLTNEKSKFSPSETLQNVTEGDFLIAKDLTTQLAVNSKIKPIYFGIIESIENGEISACDLYNIANIEIAVTPKSGNNYGMHIQNILNRYLDSSKMVSRINRTVDNSAIVPFSYQLKSTSTKTSENKIETSNLVEYMIDGFKKYGVIWCVDGIRYGLDGKIAIDTIIKKPSGQLQIKNNSESFANWEVYDKKVGKNCENKLLIINKSTSDSENPIILSTWYLKTDGLLTQSENDDVYKPTKDLIEIYDTTQENPPSYREIAQSRLAGKTFSHEINFDLLKTSNLISYSDIEIGKSTNIVYGSKTYNTVLTGYVISSENAFIHLRFGHVRSVFTQVLKN